MEGVYYESGPHRIRVFRSPLGFSWVCGEPNGSDEHGPYEYHGVRKELAVCLQDAANAFELGSCAWVVSKDQRTPVAP